MSSSFKRFPGIFYIISWQGTKIPDPLRKYQWESYDKMLRMRNVYRMVIEEKRNERKASGWFQNTGDVKKRAMKIGNK